MRVTLLAHGETEGTRDQIFGDLSPLKGDSSIEPWPSRRSVFVAPEPACLATAALLSLAAPITATAFQGLEFGCWTGRSLVDVHADDPGGVETWLRDSDANPHGGESLAAFVTRVGEALDVHLFPAAGAVVVVTPLVARAALAHALGAPASAVLHTDVAPLGSVTISGEAGRWRLTGLHQPRSRGR